MEEELTNLVINTLPEPKTFRFYDNVFNCYIHPSGNLHLTIRSTDNRFQFSLTHSDLETLTSDTLHSAGGFHSLPELEEGLRAMAVELERRGFIERQSNQESSALEVESTLDLVETETVESRIVERTSELSESSEHTLLQRIRNASLKPVLIATLAVFILNLPLSFIFSRIWVQTMLQDVAKEMARDMIKQEKR